MATLEQGSKIYNVYVMLDDEQEALMAQFTHPSRMNACLKKLRKAFPDNEYFAATEETDPDVDDLIAGLMADSNDEDEEE